MRTLIFGTVFIDTQEKYDLAAQWVKLHGTLNPECDLLLVGCKMPYSLVNIGCNTTSTDDNIGHLARGGRDGWGRAFCIGLNEAVQSQYDYVVHIEGDSLCSRRVAPVINNMYARGTYACSVPVVGTKRLETDWAETGLMFFDVRKLNAYAFINQYNWQDGAAKNKYPYTPEAHVFKMLGHDLTMLNWTVARDDMRIVRPEKVHLLDWVTHSTPEVYNAFMQHALEEAYV